MRLAITALLLSVLPFQSIAQEEERPSRASQDYEFSCAEVTEKSRAALSGEQEAALDLALFYGEIGDTGQIMYWYQVAMENGSETGRLNYATMLIQNGDELSILRAKYLLRQLVEKKVERAASLMRLTDKYARTASEEELGQPKSCDYFSRDKPDLK